MLGSRRIDAEERHDEIHADERLDIVMRLAASRVSDRICVHGSALCGNGLVGENGASGIGKDGITFTNRKVNRGWQIYFDLRIPWHSVLGTRSLERVPNNVS